MLERLGVVDRERWQEQFNLINELANNREAVCLTSLNMPLSKGKGILLETAGGQTVPDQYKDSACLQSVYRLGHWLRIVAVSACKEMLPVLNADDQVLWPEASAFSHM